ncbi:MAG: hypothetical protein QM572_12740, partial [Nocardioides sp.]|uniref:RHS repeat domain-containing protein n=1 Tax=Nocardioides sp. TaxID=35761 RepID=UPI0039E3F8F1
MPVSTVSAVEASSANGWSAGAHPSGWPISAEASNTVTFPKLRWSLLDLLAATSKPTDKTALLQVQACYSTSTALASEVCAVPWNLTYSPGGFEATASAGPGVVSLASGAYTVSVTDAAAATSIGGLSIGRTLNTLPTPAERSGPSGVFGPGWSTDAGPDAGASDLTVTDHHTDGYITFTDSSGVASTYQAAASTSTCASPSTAFTGVGDAVGDGVTVCLVSDTQIAMAEDDGTITTWQSVSGVWKVSSIAQTGSRTTTTYGYGTSGSSAGLITRILAPAPTGVSCGTADSTTPDTTPGCRSLVLTYGTVTAGSGTATRLTKVELSIPQTSGTANKIAIAQYAYDSAGRLSQVWDPRLDTTSQPALKTTYTYNSTDRLASITPPGVNGWNLVYDASNRISKISQTVPVGNPISGVTNQTATTTVVYGLPTSGTGLPDLTPATAATWGQTRSLPVDGQATAVFAPDHAPAGTTPGTVATADWPFATLHYLDPNGRETNTAAYGTAVTNSGSTTTSSTGWQISSTQYDANGNVVWQLSAANRAQALTPISGVTDSYVAGVSGTAARADLLASTTVYNPLDLSEVTDTYGPTHPIRLVDGTTIHARDHTTTTYDEGAPNSNVNPTTGQAYRLPTTVVTGPWNVATSANAAAANLTVTRSGYDAAGSMSGTIAGVRTIAAVAATPSFSGWSLGMATTSTTQMGTTASAADLIITTVYDSDGRVVSTRLPDGTGASASATSPRTTNTTYYTASGASPCGSTTLAGLVCQTAPGGQAATTGGPGDTAKLATTTISYDQLGNPTTTVEAYAAGVSRTTTVTYDALERVTNTATTTTGITGTTAVPAVAYSYDSATGLPATQSTGSGTGAKTLTTTYNSVGAVSSYVDGSVPGTTGALTYYGYDIDGRTVSTVDAKGATTWTYDTTGTGTGSERRGLVTVQRHATSPTSATTLGTGPVSSGQLDLTSQVSAFGFTPGYDPDGTQASLTYPNAMTATTVTDNAGNRTSLTYRAGSSALASFSQTIGASGRTVGQGSGINDTPQSVQVYTYDPAGRLTQVDDTVIMDLLEWDVACTRRSYSFNSHSNRTSLSTSAANSSCSADGTTTVTSSYDEADRITNQSNVTGGSYTYDQIGRTLTVPGSDATGTATHATATGQATIGYYANDMVATLNQGTGSTTQAQAFTLDPVGSRIATQTTTTGATGSTSTTATVNHYNASGDSPSWTETLTTPASGSATTTWTSNVTGPDGNLSAIVNGTGTGTTVSSVKLQILNLHGDVVAT